MQAVSSCTNNIQKNCCIKVVIHKINLHKRFTAFPRSWYLLCWWWWGRENWTGTWNTRCIVPWWYMRSWWSRIVISLGHPLRCWIYRALLRRRRQIGCTTRLTWSNSLFKFKLLSLLFRFFPNIGSFDQHNHASKRWSKTTHYVASVGKGEIIQPRSRHPHWVFRFLSKYKGDN